MWTSLASSTYYVLFAIAFALVLKVTKIWNFTQAGLMTTAFYVMYWAVNRLGLSIYLSISLALVITVLVALAVEKYAFETLRRRKSGGFTFFIFTLIFSEFAAYLFTLLFGTEPFEVDQNLRIAGMRGTSYVEKVYELFPRLKERKQQLARSLSGGERQAVLRVVNRVAVLKMGRLAFDGPKKEILAKKDLWALF